MRLTEAQRAAVTREGQDVCVVAGPGSGKTRVLVARFVWLVRERGANPHRIAAITFTEKAAAEIRSRLAAELGPEAEKAPVSTIHGLCLGILKRHFEAVGLAPNFAILDERLAQLTLREAIGAALDEMLARDPARLRALFHAWSTSDPVGDLASAFEAIRLAGDGFPPPTAPPPADAIGTRFASERETLDAVLREAAQRYRETKSAQAKVDFDDLEELTAALLDRDERLREEIAGQFDHILMDELQDTNPVQWQLVARLRRPGRFFAVGDINQAIYGFRHATPDAFRAYRESVERAGGEIDYLRENFRSRAAILEAAERVCFGMPGIERPGLKAAREFANVDAPVVELTAIENFDAVLRSAIEARWVAGEIARLTAEGRRYSDCAVLFRTGGRFPDFERAFLDAGIPYIVTGGKTFFERQEIADLLNYLRVLANPRDEIALFGVLRSPFFGWSDAEILAARDPKRSLAETVSLPALDERRRLRNQVSPDRLLARAMDACDYEGSLDAAGRANVRKLLALIRDLWAERPRTIAAIVAHFDRLREAADEPNAPAAESLDAVELMTIHSAKGLEFPVVFLAALDAMPSNESASLVYSAASGLGAKWRIPDSKGNEDDARDSFAETHRAARLPREKEEASRLLYVGMTRAEDRLYLSYGQGKSARGWTKDVKKLGISRVLSRIEEIPLVQTGFVSAAKEIAIEPLTPSAIPENPREPEPGQMSLF
ncbi:MAG: ATP-dependent helicase [Bryobacteraceae bacterium]|nr:ATP-dependent helicase [Bryobacteraceae bacterium]